MALLALYGLLATDCVTDEDTRAGRLSVALTVVFVVVVISAAVAVAVWLRGNLLQEQRFLVGPSFAATLVLLLVLWLPISQAPFATVDAPGPTAACM
jgi:hypothetical protein